MFHFLKMEQLAGIKKTFLMRSNIGRCWSAGTHMQGVTLLYRECVYKVDRWFHRTLIGREPGRTLGDKQHCGLFTVSCCLKNFHETEYII